MSSTTHVQEERLAKLQAHLEDENPVLVDAVRLFRELDLIGRRMGLLQRHESYANRISWWPLISILGTFSAGKSSFVNYYLGRKLQRTGNQAIDDKFTVICFSDEAESHVLPGVALDADPRFPFYGISDELERVSAGQGRRVDAYLQMKTCNSDALRGKTLIDSPGFDADAQRNAVLRIVDHIMDLSDLVLVFFDARHPEPGAMRDTLDHMVAATIARADSDKFVYVLNQIDTAAREDNPEDVVAAWQRSLAEKGLTAGRFYTIYNPEMAVEIPNPEQRARFEAKRDADLAEIRERMSKVEVGRAYRIVAALEKTAARIRELASGRLTEALARWRRRVLWIDAAIFGTALAAAMAATIALGWWDGLRFAPPWWDWLTTRPWAVWTVLGAIAACGIWLHFQVRRVTAQRIARRLAADAADGESVGDVAGAFRRSARPLRSIFRSRPAGWGALARRRVERVTDQTTRFVQTLNDHFAGAAKAHRRKAAPIADGAPPA